MKVEEPIAFPVRSQSKKLLIPIGLVPGDTFIFTPENGHPISVVVPENARAGTYINIVIPDEVVVEAHSSENNQNIKTYRRNDGEEIKISKATAGAALVGGLLGAAVFGSIGAVVLAGGAAYATTRKQGKIGSTARKVGSGAYSGVEDASKWISKKLSSSGRTPSSST